MSRFMIRSRDTTEKSASYVVPEYEKSVKELAQIDGAFIVASDGDCGSSRANSGRSC